MTNIKNRVIIWGVDNFNTLGLFRQLGPAGINLFFLIYGKKTGCASASKWCKEYALVDSIEDGAKYLFEHFVHETDKPIIITPGDGIIEYIDTHRVEFERCFLVSGTMERGILTKINNKNAMTALAARLGFTVPQSMECRWNTDISGVEYPCIIKPSHLTAGHYNEFKFKICKDEHELKKTLKYVRNESEFVLQQYIPKERDFLVYGCRLKDGKCLIAGILKKDRFADNGDSSHGLITADIPKCVDVSLIESFMSEIDYYGLFSVEYGYYDKKAYFFEVNLRNDGTSHYFYQAGANIPLAWVFDRVGMDFNHVPVVVMKDKWFIDEICDVANVWAGRVSRKQWKKERAEATVFKYYDESDPQPWLNMKRGRWKTLLLNSVMKKYRLYIVYLLERIKRH